LERVFSQFKSQAVVFSVLNTLEKNLFGGGKNQCI